MKISRFFCLGLGLVLLLLGSGAGRADMALPPSMLAPKSVAEAWNMIHLSTANAGRLVKEGRLDEVPGQISLCSPALRTLGRFAGAAREPQKVASLAVLGSRRVNAIAEASIAGDRARTAEALGELASDLKTMSGFFDPKAAAGEIYFCPLHPDFISEDAAKKCAECGRRLVPRRVPYSFTYVEPGAPTLTMSAAAEPLVPGQEAEVKITLTKRDGSPVLPADLLVMHTQPIHLLLIDGSLTDYHHLHPAATPTPGEYAFTFTPEKGGSYRLVAELVPVETGLPEFAEVELAGTTPAGAPADTADSYAASVGGLNFRLAIVGENSGPPQARQMRPMTITVTEADGRPVTRLEPVMNALAHLIGFYDDGKTVLHIHPSGGDILRTDVRGGPTLGFMFFPPKAGFLRLFCQVVVDGQTVFAPFNVHVAP